MAELILSAAHDGTTVSAAVGDVLVLVLGENPTTGYRWQLAVPAGLRVDRDDYAAASSSVGASGGGGQRSLRLVIERAGLHAVQALLCRAWEGAAAAQARVEFKVAAI